jgi:hypothetical protein
MSPEGARRCDLLLVGGCSTDLRELLKHRGYAVQRVRIDDVPRVNLSARATIICGETGLEPQGEALPPWLVASLDHGLGIAFYIETSVTSERLTAYQRVRVVSTELPDRIQSFYRPDDLVHWIAIYDAGPPHKDIQIEGEKAEDFEQAILFNRAVSTFPEVHAERIFSGKSGAAIWQVTPTGKLDGCAPRIVKITSLRKASDERSRRALLKGRVSSRSFATLHSDECANGHSQSALVYEFVAGAYPFATAIRHTPVPPLVSSLFKTTLRGLRAGYERSPANLYKAFGSRALHALRFTPELRAACEYPPIADLPVANFEEMQRLFESIGDRECGVGYVHGDMHSGNLFVEGTNVIMIDFGAVRPGAPLVADPACLEVSLAFPSGGMARGLERTNVLLDLGWIDRAVYEYPLDPRSVWMRGGSQRWLCEVIREIRENVREIDPDPIPYCYAVASYLVRFASYPDEDHAPLASRALAAQLAFRLISETMRQAK